MITVAIGTALVYGSVYGGIFVVGLTIWAVMRVTRKARRRWSWKAGAAYRMHVAYINAAHREREGLTGEDFEEWARELLSEEPAP